MARLENIHTFVADTKKKTLIDTSKNLKCSRKCGVCPFYMHIVNVMNVLKKVLIEKKKLKIENINFLIEL